jgi:hypothetical protein
MGKLRPKLRHFKAVHAGRHVLICASGLGRFGPNSFIPQGRPNWSNGAGWQIMTALRRSLLMPLLANIKRNTDQPIALEAELAFCSAT